MDVYMAMNPPSQLIYGNSISVADLFYVTRFSAPDSILYIRHRGKKYLLLSPLELDRGKRTAKVDHVLSTSDYLDLACQYKMPLGIYGIACAFCRKHKIKRLSVPAYTESGLVDALRAFGITVVTCPVPFFPERLIKQPAEVAHLDAAQRAVFTTMRYAEKILRDSIIRRKNLYWNGKILTSERLAAEIAKKGIDLGYTNPEGIIVACGEDATEPHNFGSGPLRAHSSIIVDIFPRSLKSYYYGDATRTYCRGGCSPELKRLYNTVKRAQLWALGQIRDGIDGLKIHRGITKIFDDSGYSTGIVKGRSQGFFHGTGHSVGLDIHEEPARISNSSFRLRAGHVMTVEPGLYYPGLGGVRIEDMVLVTKNGYKLLGGSSYPKRFEI